MFLYIPTHTKIKRHPFLVGLYINLEEKAMVDDFKSFSRQFYEEGNHLFSHFYCFKLKKKLFFSKYQNTVVLKTEHKSIIILETFKGLLINF